MVKNSFTRIPASETPEAVRIRKEAFKKLRYTSKTEENFFKALARAIKDTHNNCLNFGKPNVGYLPLKHVDKIGRVGWESLTKIVDSSETNKSELGYGVPDECWSDYQPSYDVKAIKDKFPQRLMYSHHRNQNILPLLNVFGYRGLAKLLQVEPNTVKNWRTQGVLPMIYVVAIRVIPELTRVMERNGIDIAALTPDVEPKLLAAMDEHALNPDAVREDWIIR